MSELLFRKRKSDQEIREAFQRLFSPLVEDKTKPVVKQQEIFTPSEDDGHDMCLDQEDIADVHNFDSFDNNDFYYDER